MDTYSNLAIGIIGGIIASGIVGLIILIFNKIIWPKIQELAYRGIDLSGEWKGDEFITIKVNNVDKSVKRREYNLSFNQSGHKLNGDLYVKNIDSNTNEEEFSYYSFDGIIKDNFVHLKFGPKSKKTFGIGGLLLKVVGGGNTLNGSLISTEKTTSNIMTIDNLKFLRK